MGTDAADRTAIPARVLIVDDEANIRMMMRLALQHVGHAVGTAADGMEGLERYGDGRGWDVVLLDQRMPGMEGLDVLREMRRRDPGARVVMVTAFGTIDLAAEASEAGAVDFLRKPFTPEVLRGVVTAALASRALPGDGAGGYAGSTVNGFAIEGAAAAENTPDGRVACSFTVRNPAGERHPCTVELAASVAQAVRALSGPGRGGAWEDLCQEALANYLWQNAEMPPDGVLRVGELTTALRRKVESAGTRGTR